MPTLRATAGATSLALCAPAQTLIWLGEPIATIDAEHLRAYVPAGAAEQFKPLIARADLLYAHMMRDAGFQPSRKLRVLVADWSARRKFKLQSGIIRACQPHG